MTFNFGRVTRSLKVLFLESKIKKTRNSKRPGEHLTKIQMRFLIEILMSVAVITHEIFVRFLFDYVGIHVSHNQIRISQVSHE